MHKDICIKHIVHIDIVVEQVGLMMHLEITMVPFTWRDRLFSYPQSSATQSDGSIDGKRVEWP